MGASSLMRGDPHFLDSSLDPEITLAPAQLSASWRCSGCDHGPRKSPRCRLTGPPSLGSPLLDPGTSDLMGSCLLPRPQQPMASLSLPAILGMLLGE